MHAHRYWLDFFFPDTENQCEHIVVWELRYAEFVENYKLVDDIKCRSSSV